MMSNRWILYFGVILIAAFSSLNAEVISSRPAGVMKISLDANEQKMVSLPFSPFDSSIEAVLGEQLKGTPDGIGSDLVYKWDSSALTYVYATKADGTGNADVDGKWYSSLDPLIPSDMLLKPGEGFVIWNKQGQLQNIYLVGDVVLNGTNRVVLNPALNMVGYPYSSGSKVPSNMVFTSDAGTGYVAATTLEMGRGYWVENTNITAEIWTEIRPYSVDIFPPQGTKPDILWINVSDTGNTGRVELILAIDCEGLPADEKLDIYYKDVPADGTFESDRNWFIAETDIPVRGRGILEWMDKGFGKKKDAQSSTGGQKSAISVARYYLIGRASVDEDLDGIPDARQKFVSGKPVLAGAGIRGLNLHSDSSASSNLVSAAPAPSPVSSFRISRIIYVDRKIGANHLSGRSSSVLSPDGPKKTIRAGLEEAGNEGNTLIIKSGTYGEDLNIAGNNISVRIEGNVDLRNSSQVSVITIPAETNFFNSVTNR